jgi:hypothetical protein
MNAKKIARRARALERFNILNFHDAKEAKEQFDVEYTMDHYNLYLQRKREEYKTLGGT